MGIGMVMGMRMGIGMVMVMEMEMGIGMVMGMGMGIGMVMVMGMGIGMVMVMVMGIGMVMVADDGTMQPYFIVVEIDGFRSSTTRHKEVRGGHGVEMERVAEH